MKINGKYEITRCTDMNGMSKYRVWENGKEIKRLLTMAQAQHFVDHKRGLHDYPDHEVFE